MLYAILCYNDEAAVTGWSKAKDEAVMADLGVVMGGLAAQGRLGPVARLLPTNTAVTLRKTADAPVVLDGPFAETKEQFLGFYVVDADDLEAALALARDLADANPGTGSYEIRPLQVLTGGVLNGAVSA